MAGQKINRRQKDVSRMMRERKNITKARLSVSTRSQSHKGTPNHSLRSGSGHAKAQ